MKIKNAIKLLMVAVLLSSAPALAQRRKSVAAADEESSMPVTYDLSAAVGSYDGYSYDEITLGLNWYLADWFNWRNSVFTRQGSGLDSIQGLDSAGLFIASTRSSGGTFGIDAFAGPGVRFANQNSNAVFGEAGLLFKLGGLHIGVGAKALSYVSNRVDATGAALPKTDTQTFIILSGGGVL